LGETGEIHQIEGARAMDSLQGSMMRLVLAPKPMKGIDQKLLKLQDRQSGQNTSENHENEKHYNTT
jgi:hypothetical protein